jgi:hypothetical protein
VRIELFFKWIKQHLRIKACHGTSDRAVRTQVWIASSVYQLVAILKKRLRLPASLSTILQIFSLTLFEKTPILQALSQTPPPTIMPDLDRLPAPWSWPGVGNGTRSAQAGGPSSRRTVRGPPGNIRAGRPGAG